MRSVADDLRARTAARVLAMPVAERISLARSLGDDDLDRFVRSSGLGRAEALAVLRASSAQGRRVSAAAAPPPTDDRARHARAAGSLDVRELLRLPGTDQLVAEVRRLAGHGQSMQELWAQARL